MFTSCSHEIDEAILKHILFPVYWPIILVLYLIDRLAINISSFKNPQKDRFSNKYIIKKIFFKNHNIVFITHNKVFCNVRLILVAMGQSEKAAQKTNNYLWLAYAISFVYLRGSKRCLLYLKSDANCRFLPLF